jgi:4-hydroxy-tetrahydrodipicolinate synthase
VVSVLGNVAPALVQSMIRAFRERDTEEAKRLHLCMFAFTKSLFIETNPAPVKRALATLGLIQEELRLPLVPVSKASAERIDAALAQLPLDRAAVRSGTPA